MSAGAYIEGYIAFGRVSDSHGARVFEVEVPYKEPVVRSLGAGGYRLDFWTRPCDAICGNLDPVAERCRAMFQIRAGQVTGVHAVVRPGRCCDVSLG